MLYKASSSSPNPLMHLFIDLALNSGSKLIWNMNRPFPNSSHKVGYIAQNVFEWCTKERKPQVRFLKTAPHLKLHACWQSLNLMQRNHTSAGLLANAKPRLVWYISRQRRSDRSTWRTYFHCFEVQWQQALHHSFQHLALIMAPVDQSMKPIP